MKRLILLTVTMLWNLAIAAQVFKNVNLNRVIEDNVINGVNVGDEIRADVFWDMNKNIMIYACFFSPANCIPEQDVFSLDRLLKGRYFKLSVRSGQLNLLTEKYSDQLGFTHFFPSRVGSILGDPANDTLVIVTGTGWDTQDSSWYWEITVDFNLQIKNRQSVPLHQIGEPIGIGLSFGGRALTLDKRIVTKGKDLDGDIVPDIIEAYLLDTMGNIISHNPNIGSSFAFNNNNYAVQPVESNNTYLFLPRLRLDTTLNVVCNLINRDADASSFPALFPDGSFMSARTGYFYNPNGSSPIFVSSYEIVARYEQGGCTIDTIHYKTFNNEENALESFPGYDGVQFIDSSNIYFSAVRGVLPPLFAYGQEVHLTNITLDGEENWWIYFAGTDPNIGYIPMTMLPLMSGGLIMLLGKTEYLEDLNLQKSSIVAALFDRNGNPIDSIPTSTDEVISPKNCTVSVFPNPTDGIVRFTSSNCGDNFTFVVFDSLGRIVLAKTAIDEKFENAIGPLLSGIYTYSLIRNSSGERVSGKIIVR